MKSAHFIRYRAVGLNRANLLNTLRKNGVALHKVVAKGNKITEFSIEAADSRKFFAITENLCYNIIRIKEHGFLYPLVGLMRNVGVIIGAAVFLAAAIVADRTVLAVDYGGSGAIYKEEAQAVLDEMGIKKFAFVRDADLRAAENAILRSSDRFTFAAIKKRGSRLTVNLALSPSVSGVIDASRKNLYAPAAGVVESVRVYRGTALVRAGDYVEAGAALIAGYNDIKDKRVETYVLGTVSMLIDFECTYEGEESGALPFARESVGDCEVVEEYVEAIGEAKFAVRLKYRIKVK